MFEKERKVRLVREKRGIVKVNDLFLLSTSGYTPQQNKTTFKNPRSDNALT